MFPVGCFGMLLDEWVKNFFSHHICRLPLTSHGRSWPWPCASMHKVWCGRDGLCSAYAQAVTDTSRQPISRLWLVVLIWALDSRKWHYSTKWCHCSQMFSKIIFLSSCTTISTQWLFWKIWKKIFWQKLPPAALTELLQIWHKSTLNPRLIYLTVLHPILANVIFQEHLKVIYWNFKSTGILI